MDTEAQTRALDELQATLTAAGYETQQNTDSPDRVLLNVWHPSRPTRRLTIHVTKRAGEVVYLSELGRRTANDQIGAPLKVMAKLAQYTLGDPNL